MTISKTYIPKKDKIERRCYVIDAKDKILGKVAVKAAVLLRGKHKATFTRHLDVGDQVIIVNAGKIRVTGKKMTQKQYQRYSGYPSGQKTLRLEELLAKAPTQAMRLAVNRMIPAGKLGNKIRRRLRVYAGESHPHTAQKPIPMEIA